MNPGSVNSFLAAEEHGSGQSRLGSGSGSSRFSWTYAHDYKMATSPLRVMSSHRSPQSRKEGRVAARTPTVDLSFAS